VFYILRVLHLRERNLCMEKEIMDREIVDREIVDREIVEYELYLKYDGCS
jgi:hypothetical protein